MSDMLIFREVPEIARLSLATAKLTNRITGEHSAWAAHSYRPFMDGLVELKLEIQEHDRAVFDDAFNYLTRHIQGTTLPGTIKVTQGHDSQITYEGSLLALIESCPRIEDPEFASALSDPWLTSHFERYVDREWVPCETDPRILY